MRRKAVVSPKGAHVRDCAIRAAIGRMLSAQYNLAEPLPEGLKDLLERLDNADETAGVRGQRNSHPRAA
jgi:hypothetical protein